MTPTDPEPVMTEADAEAATPRKTPRRRKTALTSEQRDAPWPTPAEAPAPKAKRSRKSAEVVGDAAEKLAEAAEDFAEAVNSAAEAMDKAAAEAVRQAAAEAVRQVAAEAVRQAALAPPKESRQVRRAKERRAEKIVKHMQTDPNLYRRNPYNPTMNRAMRRHSAGR